MAVRTYAARDARVAQWCFPLFSDRNLSPLFLKGNTFLQSVLAKKKAAANVSLPQSVSTPTEALLHFHRIGYANSCLQARCHHEKLH